MAPSCIGVLVGGRVTVDGTLDAMLYSVLTVRVLASVKSRDRDWCRLQCYTAEARTPERGGSLHVGAPTN